jgi:hypothetical protein
LNDVDRALSQIADIRSRMAASTRFRGFGPHAVALTGLLAVGVALAQTLWPAMLAPDDLTFVAVWAGAAAIAIAIVASETLTRSRRLHGPMADSMIGGTLRLFLPFAVAGALIAFVLVTVAPESVTLLPGLWQMLVALAGFAAVPSLPRPIIWAAGWYLLTGTIVLTLAGQSGSLSPWMMGVPLGIGQGLVAAVLHMAANDGNADG